MRFRHIDIFGWYTVRFETCNRRECCFIIQIDRAISPLFAVRILYGKNFTCFFLFFIFPIFPLSLSIETFMRFGKFCFVVRSIEITEIIHWSQSEWMDQKNMISKNDLIFVVWWSVFDLKERFNFKESLQILIFTVQYTIKKVCVQLNDGMVY